MKYPSIDELIGNTPLIRLQRIDAGRGNTLLLKLEGQNPAGSVKDRPALMMIRGAETRGEIQPGDRLIEATSGNTGIALAMVAAILGYPLTLIMPETMTEERRASMAAYGAKLILVSEDEGMEGARDLALKMQADGEGKVLDQFSNADNPRAHYETTGPEIWRDTQGGITHFVSAMGTTGTIMGTARYLKEVNADIQIIGVHPDENASIPGIRKWPDAYLPAIYDQSAINLILQVSQEEAEIMTRRLASEEGVFCGISSGGAVAASAKLAETLQNATIVTIICDRGDRYISSGVFSAP
ncbi:MAG TPA: cysteine synthase B [Gammaproteobacteria bacterium]|nr:cysteine synthase B [Gammaproteobacteria bacterium]